MRRLFLPRCVDGYVKLPRAARVVEHDEHGASRASTPSVHTTHRHMAAGLVCLARYRTRLDAYYTLRASRQREPELLPRQAIEALSLRPSSLPGGEPACRDWHLPRPKLPDFVCHTDKFRVECMAPVLPGPNYGR